VRIAVAFDERLPLAEAVLAWLDAAGHAVTAYGPPAGETQPWPEVAGRAAGDVAAGRADQGIVMCWTGTGASIAANKVPGIRAALCADAETARGARLWNNANVLALSMRLTSDIVAREILETWFDTAYQPNPADDRALALLEDLEQARRQR
jgi:ribose 5-phosphate isomerase B